MTQWVKYMAHEPGNPRLFSGAHSGKRKELPEVAILISTCSLWHVCALHHTHKTLIIISEQISRVIKLISTLTLLHK